MPQVPCGDRSRGKIRWSLRAESSKKPVAGLSTEAEVVLVSDGLETCGGDPCQAIRDAKAAGVDFVVLVVGFAVGEGDVPQLECIAQEGEILSFSARNASELGATFAQLVATPAELPEGRLSIQGTKDGELTDALVVVTQAETGEEVTRGYPRTDLYLTGY